MTGHRLAGLAAWDLDRPVVESMTGGWNASVWRVTTPSGRYVAKRVDAAEADQFTAGLRVADALADTGLRTGRPVPTRAGELTARDGDHVLALLTEVPGRHVDPTRDEDLTAMGRALATVHHRLVGHADLVGQRSRWPWTWPAMALDRLGAPEPLRAAVLGAVRAGERAGDRLTVGVVHGDPAPDCVLVDGAEVGVVDWAAVMTGPLLYDLATVRVLTDQPTLERVVAGYLDTGLGARPAELADLPVALGPRWAAHAVYFWGRIARAPPGDRRARTRGTTRTGCVRRWPGWAWTGPKLNRSWP